MPYISEPGWLQEAISQGVNTFQQFRSKRDRDRQLDIQNRRADEELGLARAADTRVAEAARIANFLPSLRNEIVGAKDTTIPGSVLNQAAGLAPMAGFGGGAPTGLGAATGGFKDTVLPGIARYSDIQRAAVGLPTSLDTKKQTFEAATVDASLKSLPEDLQQQRFAKLEPILRNAADRFVAGPILRAGGRLNKNALPQLAEQAYQAFLKNSQTQKYGNMTPEDQGRARAYFDQSVKEALDQQTRLDVARLNALPSSAFGTRDTKPQMINALSNLANKADGLADDMLKIGPLKYWINMDQRQLSPEQQAQVQKYQEAKQVSKQLFAAASQFGADALDPATAQKILQQASDMLLGTGGGGGGVTSPADIQKMPFAERRAQASQEWNALPPNQRTAAKQAEIASKWGLK